MTSRPQVSQLTAGHEVTSLESVVSELSAVMQRRLEAAERRRPARLLAAEVETFHTLLVSVTSCLVTAATDRQLQRMEESLLQTMAPLFGAEGAGQLQDQVSQWLDRGY